MVEGDTPPVNATALSIRKRYNHGKASNDVAEAGLLVHCFDGTEGADAPWKPCTTGTCNQFQWWWSASFINLVQLANPNPNPKPNPNPDPTPTPNPSTSLNPNPNPNPDPNPNPNPNPDRDQVQPDLIGTAGIILAPEYTKVECSWDTG